MSSGCKEFCLHKMSDGSVDLACVMNAFSNSVSDGRVVELDVPTRAGLDATAPRWPGWNSRVSSDAGGYCEVCRQGGQRGRGAIVPRSAAQGDDAEGFDMGMAIDGANPPHDNLGVVLGVRGLCEGSCRRDLGRHRSSTPTAGPTAREPSTERFLGRWAGRQGGIEARATGRT